MREALSARFAAALDALTRVSGGEWEQRVLEESPDGRAVLEYRRADRRVVAKLRADRGGEADAALLESLARAGTRVLRVPHVVLWDAGSGALMTEAAEGFALRGCDPARDAAALTRAGEALRELHALPLRRGTAKRVRDHVAELIRPAPEDLAAAFPRHAAAIRQTLAELERAEQGWGALPEALIHRDFHLRQLFDDGEHLTVLDWDDAAVGDPAFDVGYFTAYLRTHYAPEAAEAGVRAFREGYGESVGVWERVPVYERFNLLRRACRRFRLRDEGWERELHAMLTRLS